MFNKIRKVLSAYIQTEEQFTKLQYVMIKNQFLFVQKFINTFPKNQRTNAIKHVIELAILGYSRTKIIDKLKIEPLKYNVSNDKFDKQLKKLRKDLLLENGISSVVS